MSEMFGFEGEIRHLIEFDNSTYEDKVQHFVEVHHMETTNEEGEDKDVVQMIGEHDDSHSQKDHPHKGVMGAC